MDVAYTAWVNWRLLNNTVASGEMGAATANGAWNMALDEALLQSMNQGEAPVLRFYDWRPPCLSLGRFQRATGLTASSNADSGSSSSGILGGVLGVDWVRRPTGGRAVWHEHEITYSVVLREELLSHDARSVVDSYRRISEGFLQGLQMLGINARIATADPQNKVAQSLPLRQSSTRLNHNFSSNCFDLATRADFVVDGRKLLGAAQCRKNGAILQHGSLLLDVDENLWLQRAGGTMANVVTLKSLGVQASRTEIVAALCQGMQRAWKTSLSKSRTNSRELALANFLYEEKYLTEKWNRSGLETVEKGELESAG